MPKPPLILLPPSEGKAPGGSGPPVGETTGMFDALAEPQAEVVQALARAMKGSKAARQKLLGVGAAATAEATAANLAVSIAPTMPAIERYTGVLYDALGAPTLPGPARRRMNARLVIFSGLWGAVAAGDPVPDYKLKMGASLPRLGKLSTWWRPHLADVLGAKARGRTVWDLLPNEHAAAFTSDDHAARTIRVRFLETKPGKGLVTVSHWNKLLKGALVRHLLVTGEDGLEGLESFDHDGFVWEQDRTEADGTTVTVDIVRR